MFGQTCPISVIVALPCFCWKIFNIIYNYRKKGCQWLCCSLGHPLLWWLTRRTCQGEHVKCLHSICSGSHCKMILQAAVGTAGGNRVWDLAEAGSEDFRGTAARLDRLATRQGHWDILLQDSKVPGDPCSTMLKCSNFTAVWSGTALRMSWCLSSPRWGRFMSWGWWLSSAAPTGPTVMSGSNLQGIIIFLVSC